MEGLDIRGPNGGRLLLRANIDFLRGFFGSVLKRRKGVCVPCLVAIIVCVKVTGVFNIFKFMPPAGSLGYAVNLTVADVFLVRCTKFRGGNLGNFLGDFTRPTPVVLPVGVLRIIVQPASLYVQLFNGILKDCIIVGLLRFVYPTILPVPFDLCFSFFSKFVRTCMFMFLASLFVGRTVRWGELLFVRRCSACVEPRAQSVESGATIVGDAWVLSKCSINRGNRGRPLMRASITRTSGSLVKVSAK